MALARDWGVVPTHIDSHQHVHMRPALYRIFEEEARRFGIERIRFCREPFPRFGLRLGVGQVIRRNNYTKWALIRRFAGTSRPTMTTTDQFFGVLYSGIISRDLFHALINAGDPHTSLEIGIHPGFPCTPQELSSAEAGFEEFISSPMRQVEHDLLTDPDLGALLRSRWPPRAYDGTIKHSL